MKKTQIASQLRIFLIVLGCIIHSGINAHSDTTIQDVTINVTEFNEAPPTKFKFNGFIVPNIPTPDVYDNTNTYAIIISGGVDANCNVVRLWNNTAFIYATLKNIYKIPQNNIFLAMGDGDNPEADVSFQEVYTNPLTVNASSPLDLDNDGINDLKYSATPRNVSKIFADAADKIPENAHLIVYLSGHGGLNSDGRGKYMTLWNDTEHSINNVAKLYPSELKDYLNKIKCANKTIILNNINAGVFINTLCSDGTAILSPIYTKIAPTSALTPSFGYLYDEFTLHLTSGLSGYKPTILGNELEQKYVITFKKLCNADTNNDSVISIKEAFDYACTAITNTNDDPACIFQPEYLGEEAGLDRVVSPYQAYMRDDFGDDCTQPNENATDWWYSPDVWLRPADDGSVEPYYPASMDNVSTLYAYARVINCGWKDRPAKGYVHFYYDLSTLGTDKTTWAGGFSFNNRITGGYIGKAALPAIDVWDEAIVSCKWTLPSTAKINGFENIGILAIISDSSTRPYYPVADNSEILGKKTVAYHSASAKTFGSTISTNMLLANPSNSSDTFTIALSPQFYNYSWDYSLFDRADVRIVFPTTNTYSTWVSNGRKGNNYTVINTNPFEVRLNSFNSTIGGISVAGRSTMLATLKLIPKNTQSGTAFSLTQVQESTNKTIGGHTFQLNPAYQFQVLIDAQQEDGTCNSLLTALLPDDTDTENVSYRWTNSKGEILSEEQTVRVTAAATAEETYSVSVQKDEESGIASITIESEPVMSLGVCTTEKVSVTLAKELDSRYALTVSSSVQGRVKTIAVTPNELQYEIPFESNGNEVITVTLSDGNTVIQSIKTIVK